MNKFLMLMMIPVEEGFRWGLPVKRVRQGLSFYSF